ncbi:MAG: type I restriction enzyme endonuclease domain-containing protein, partial [Armatimonadota bacterium]
VAADIIDHFEKRQEAFIGKAMIVCMSRRIAVELYEEIIKVKPNWHDDDMKKGEIKVVMTSNNSDDPSWNKHKTSKQNRKEIGERFKDVNDPLKLVIVRDMWLTGFDVPCLHTMYVDKPMKGHNLMQAIARVNRVFKDKPGGLIVDYIGIASDLKTALATYTESGGKGTPTLDQAEAVATMLEKFEMVEQMFDGFDYKKFFDVDTNKKLTVLLEAQEFILNKDHQYNLDDKDSFKHRFIRQVTMLSQSFALSVPHPEALAIKGQVGFFQAVKARLVKFEKPTNGNGKSNAEIESAIRQIVDNAVVTDKVIDIFDAAGIQKPDISILSDEFLEDIKHMERKNLALELLKKILKDEIQNRSRKNLIQSKKFSEMLDNAIKRYNNNFVTSIEVLEELIRLAKEMKEADKRGDILNLSEDELAFYDALANNQSAREILEDKQLAVIAVEVFNGVRKNATIDWTLKESVRAKLRRDVKRVLNKHGYPPDMQALATENILKQAELLASEIVLTP